MCNKKRSWILILFTFLLVLGTLLLTIPARSDALAVEMFQEGFSTPTLTPVHNGSDATLYATIFTPPGVSPRPYIIIIAYGDIPDDVSLEIRGRINDQIEFVCNGNPCELSLMVDSVVNFLVYAASGNVSQEYTATIRVMQSSGGGYMVSVESFSPTVYYADGCSKIWNLTGAQYPGWARFTQSPLDLRTGETLHYLAGRLIDKGIVDASDCPNGGMAGTGPNGCGIERTRQAMIDWQNQYDLDIWLAAQEVGIPPKLLKTLILRESQFWPGNSRYFMAEFGLAQVNDFGADVALRWDYDLYKQVCATVMLDCSIPYMARSSSARAMLRGALIDWLDAQCPTCDYGLDMEVAHASINTITHILYANCKEANYVLSSNKVVANSYEDLWKFTMVNYHSGIYCLDTAVKAVAGQKKNVDWLTISPNLTCPGALQYVNDFWYALTTFDNKVLPLEPSEMNLVKPVPIPTPTIVPTPTPFLSTARIRVHVFVDKNANDVPETSEGVRGVIVQLTLQKGVVVFGVTDNDGEVIFKPSDQEAGQTVTISLLGLYRSDTVTLPERGELQVVFKFSQPSLPTGVP